MDAQTVAIIVLISAAVLLLIRQIYRLATGKSGGCGCGQRICQLRDPSECPSSESCETTEKE